METATRITPALAVALALFPAEKLRRGQIVFHRLFGSGSVIEEWKNFRACKACYRETPLGAASKVMLINGQILKEEKPVHCTKCGGPTHVISGAGIYNVLFEDGKTRSINAFWLRAI